MPNTKKAAPAKKRRASSKSSFSIVSRKPGKNKKTHISIGSTVRTLSIKIYDEQLPEGWSKLCQAIRLIDKSKYQVIAIKHDKDISSDSFWETALEKPHYHIIFRCLNGKNVHVSTVLKMLSIVYRKGVDDDLINNHGLETVGDFSAMTAYLTHETRQAQRDAKHIYDRSELVSNLSREEIDQVRDGYLRVSEKRKFSAEEWESLDKESFQRGYEFQDWDDWANSLPFSIRNHRNFRTIKDSYYQGVETRLQKHEGIVRCCIFIQGDPNSGKTYASEQSIPGKILRIGGGGSGKFDRLRVSHNGILVDDDVVPNLLNMSDNYPCHAYRRCCNNPVWAGRYLVITSNLSFKDYLISCGFGHTCSFGKRVLDDDDPHYLALLSRFYLCNLETDPHGVAHLMCTHLSNRGAKDEQEQRNQMFADFQKSFDSVLRTYVAPERSQLAPCGINSSAADIFSSSLVELQTFQEELSHLEYEFWEMKCVVNHFGKDGLVLDFVSDCDEWNQHRLCLEAKIRNLLDHLKSDPAYEIYMEQTEVSDVNSF